MTLRLPSPELWESSGQSPEVGQQLGALTDGAVRLTPTSLTFLETPEFEEWEQVGHLLQQMESAVMWWLGDWAAYGDDAYGEDYAQAIRVHEITGKPLGSVRVAQWVSDRYEVAKRLAGLSWPFHMIAGSLKEPGRSTLLRQARVEGWTAQQLREEIRKLKRKDKLDDPGPLAVGEYRTLIVDPPWEYPKGTAFDRPQSLPDAHYGTLSDEEIVGFEARGTPIARLAPEDAAHLYLWTTQHHLRLAFSVMDAWEFEYRHTLTWCKPSLGTGAYFRNTSEFVLFGVRGNLPAKVHDQGTWFEAPTMGHSAKPEEFYRIVERMSLPPYLDLFGRTQREGWTVWGNEVGVMSGLSS